MNALLDREPEVATRPGSNDLLRHAGRHAVAEVDRRAADELLCAAPSDDFSNDVRHSLEGDRLFPRSKAGQGKVIATVVGLRLVRRDIYVVDQVAGNRNLSRANSSLWNGLPHLGDDDASAVLGGERNCVGVQV